MKINEEKILEHAYLISRGARHLALVVTLPPSDNPPSLLLSRLENVSACYSDVIPFVHKEDHGLITCGFAKERWVLELYKWVHDSKVPEKYRDMIIGLLCGYSTEALRTCNDYKSVIL